MLSPQDVLQIIDEKFYEGVLGDEHLSQMVLDWEEFQEISDFDTEKIKEFMLKDMVIELLRMLNVRNYQIRAIGCS